MRVNAISLKGCTRKNLFYYDKMCRSYVRCEKKIIECEIIALMSFGISEQQARKAIEQARKVK